MTKPISPVRFDIRQSVQYANYLRSQGWIVERIKNTNYFIKTFPLLGGLLKIQRPLTVDFKTIKNLEKKYRIFKTIIEPNDYRQIKELTKYKYGVSGSPFLPTATLFLDLTKPVSTITANFKKDARYAIRKGSGLIIKECSKPSDIKEFYVAWKKSVNYLRYVPNVRSLTTLKKSFPQSHSIFLASHNNFGRIIGGAIFTRISHGNDTVCYYWYGFTSKEGRASLSQYSLLQRGILWAKGQNCKHFDFEGIYDQRFPLSSWKGFTHFKKSFGGTEVLYPGCFTKLRFPY